MQRGQQKSLIVAALIALAGALTFANSLDNGFHYDDEHSILKNPHIRSLRHIPTFFIDPSMFSGLEDVGMYRPVLLCSYAFNYALGGYQTWGYHLINMLLHIANGVLVWVVGRRLMPTGLGALAAGLLFVCHPLACEPVNYISSRSSLLVTLFYLLGIWAYARSVAAGSTRQAWAAVGWYISALGAKATGITLPGLAWLWPDSSRGQPAKWIYGLLAGVAGLYTWSVWALADKAFGAPVRSFYIQTATQIKAVTFYIMKTAMPIGLSVEPQFRQADGLGETPVVLAGAWALSLVLVGWRLRRQCPVWVYGGLWWGITLLPVLLVPLNVLVNEHRLYLPLVGWVWGIAYLCNQVRSLKSVGVWVMVGSLAVLAAQRNKVWEDEEALWRDAVEKGSLMARPHVNLAKAYLENERYDEAIVAAKNALAIDPGLVRAHYNLATAYLHKHRLEEAEAYYRRALEIQPGLVEAHINLGNVYLENGRWRAAVAAYNKALAKQPQAQIYHNIATAYLSGGQTDSAVVTYKRALTLGERDPETYKGLAKSLHTAGDFEAALMIAVEARDWWPDAPVFGLMAGDLYAALGREEAALAAYRDSGRDTNASKRLLAQAALERGDWLRASLHFRDILKKDREDIEALCGLARVLTEQGQQAEALGMLREAAHLAPENAPVYAQLGQTYSRAKRPLEAQAAWRALLAQAYEQGGSPDAAVSAYEKAIALDPAAAAAYLNLGLLVQGQGDLRQAERLFNATIERAPHSVKAWYNLGTLYLEQERYAEALAMFSEALALDRDAAEVYINLAAAHLALKEDEQALAAYERFLALPAGNPQLRQQIVSRLQHLQERLTPLCR
jgi:tetratricopeptide (TPR) repeat protein